MAPPKKAAKKAAKKFVHHPELTGPMKKKAHDKDGKKKRKGTKDLRRSYEHMGRVDSLAVVLSGSPSKVIQALTSLAETNLKAGEYKEAADLLRAAEHFAFAVLATEHAEGLSSDLSEAISDHLEELRKKAEEHWDGGKGRPEGLVVIYKAACAGSERALKNGTHHRALEFARAAEALAHVKGHLPFRDEGLELTAADSLELEG